MSTAAAAEPAEAGRTTVVEVRRRGTLFGVVGVAAAAVAAAYLWRALDTGALLDRVLGTGLAVLAALHLAALVDSRLPLLVADERGVRLRLGRAWSGVRWPDVADLEHLPQQGPWHDGRLTLVPRDPEALAEPLDARGRRRLRRATRWHGQAWSVPLGLGTRVVTDGGDLPEALSSLWGRPLAAAASLPPGPASEDARVTPGPETEAASPHAGPDPVVAGLRWRDPRPALASGIGSLAGRVRLSGSRASADGAATGTAPIAASAAPAPLREPHRARRAEISLGLTQGALALAGDEATAPVVLPEAAHLRRGDLLGASELGRDEAEPREEGEEPTQAIVLPAGEPVIGPGLAEARTRLGLTVDQLAERTRIRPHVIESIEHDDFAACGGDFYARGHLRTLARVLGIDAAPLLTAYDEHYAVGPVSPRRVFEAELGRGTVRDLQGSRSGPTWSVLVAAVMAVVLAWSVARLVMDGPVPLDPAPGLGSDSGGVRGARPAGDAVPVLLRAPDGGARVVVRDGNGRIAFTGDLAFGASHSLSAIPPVRVESTDGSVEVVVNGQDHGALGETGRPTSQVFDGR